MHVSVAAEIDLSLPLQTHKQIVEIRRIYQELKEVGDKHALRVRFSWCIFGLLCVWLALVVVCVFMAGFKTRGFVLSEKVLITFITSTTIDVIGVFGIAAKWIYPKPVQVDLPAESDTHNASSNDEESIDENADEES